MITEAELKEFVEDTKWLHSHYDEVLDKYNGQYIAIRKQGVVESGENMKILRDRLEKREIEPHQIFIEYVRDRRNELR